MSDHWVEPGRLSGSVRAPPSKSYTHRELVASFFADRPTRLIGPLRSADTERTARGLVQMGARISKGSGAWTIRPPALGPVRSRRTVRIDCGESGTTLRFLAAVAATRPGRVLLEGSPALARRPIRPLLAALERHGASIRGPPRGRSLPVEIAGPIHPGRWRVDVSESSQYLSALLLVLPSLPGPSSLRTVGHAVSEPYVRSTLDVLDRRGVRWHHRGRRFRTVGSSGYGGGGVRVPGDASSAAYLWAGAAVTGGTVRVRGIPPVRPQADLALLDLLERFGARVRRLPDGAEVSGDRRGGFSADVTDCPDLLPLLAALAGSASRPCGLSGAPHASRKESDRWAAATDLARAMGCRVARRSRGIRIVPSTGVRPLGRVWSTDHRVVMSAAIASLTRGGRVPNAEAVAKSFPAFWQMLRALGAEVRGVRGR